MTAIIITLPVNALTALVFGITIAHHLRDMAKEPGQVRHAVIATAGGTLFMSGVVASYAALQLWKGMIE